ncbi:MAG: SRPBCC domain-containing protein [Niabella sp.]|nr:SRPBCC domain-containing protein [Niabella sp.]
MALNISKITINTSIQKVWNALTHPALVKQWQYGSDLKTNWEPGTPIRFSAEWQGQVFEQWGTVLEVQPYHFIKYNLFAPRPDLEDKPENYFIMEYLLTDNGDTTDLEMRQTDNRPHAVQEKPQGEENPVLQQLREVAVSN